MALSLVGYYLFNSYFTTPTDPLAASLGSSTRNYFDLDSTLIEVLSGTNPVSINSSSDTIPNINLTSETIRINGQITNELINLIQSQFINYQGIKDLLISPNFKKINILYNSNLITSNKIHSILNDVNSILNLNDSYTSRFNSNFNINKNNANNTTTNINKNNLNFKKLFYCSATLTLLISLLISISIYHYNHLNKLYFMSFFYLSLDLYLCLHFIFGSFIYLNVFNDNSSQNTNLNNSIINNKINTSLSSNSSSFFFIKNSFNSNLKFILTKILTLNFYYILISNLILLTIFYQILFLKNLSNLNALSLNNINLSIILANHYLKKESNKRICNEFLKYYYKKNINININNINNNYNNNYTNFNTINRKINSNISLNSNTNNNINIETNNSNNDPDINLSLNDQPPSSNNDNNFINNFQKNQDILTNQILNTNNDDSSIIDTFDKFNNITMYNSNDLFNKNNNNNNNNNIDNTYNPTKNLNFNPENYINNDNSVNILNNNIKNYLNFFNTKQYKAKNYSDLQYFLRYIIFILLFILFSSLYFLNFWKKYEDSDSDSTLDSDSNDSPDLDLDIIKSFNPNLKIDKCISSLIISSPTLLLFIEPTLLVVSIHANIVNGIYIKNFNLKIFENLTKIKVMIFNNLSILNIYSNYNNNNIKIFELFGIWKESSETWWKIVIASESLINKPISNSILKNNKEDFSKIRKIIQKYNKNNGANCIYFEDVIGRGIFSTIDVDNIRFDVKIGNINLFDKNFVKNLEKDPEFNKIISNYNNNPNNVDTLGKSNGTKITLDSLIYIVINNELSGIFSLVNYNVKKDFVHLIKYLQDSDYRTGFMYDLKNDTNASNNNNSNKNESPLTTTISGSTLASSSELGSTPTSGVSSIISSNSSSSSSVNYPSLESKKFNNEEDIYYKILKALNINENLIWKQLLPHEKFEKIKLLKQRLVSDTIGYDIFLGDLRNKKFDNNICIINENINNEIDSMLFSSLGDINISLISNSNQIFNKNCNIIIIDKHLKNLIFIMEFSKTIIGRFKIDLVIITMFTIVMNILIGGLGEYIFGFNLFNPRISMILVIIVSSIILYTNLSIQYYKTLKT
ncbi:uncharacterized protein ASCRUDRAFT_78088 [Ascoidea rubescens DSM 1968]|uniref:Uncharacterized protein n=1 Tax=Ascoidea rubescens DSM 1968 TaxID=1344418 RepID=A0A1D2V9D4_9ASCO|nr:hypothetical protein ASCRUDRAFT_78088 [Ascoidea rubescens DSM 1968]ODV58179.1 hypothetical protein ASCRUDRAFT_78088 [Ascoidea rubescens DSM 1968]